VNKHMMLVAAAAALCALLFAFAPSSKANVAGDPFNRPFATIACTTNCWDGAPTCPSGKHAAWDDEELNHECGVPHAEDEQGNILCASNSCALMHPIVVGCDCESFQQLRPEPLRAAVVNDDVKGLLRIVSESAPHVEVNYSRNAVQIMDCEERVIAHLPLSTKVIEALTAEVVR